MLVHALVLVLMSVLVLVLVVGLELALVLGDYWSLYFDLCLMTRT